jgi:hypothetical protein
MCLLRHPFLYWRRWGTLLPYLLCALLLVGTVSQAQAQTPQHVIVTLRDAANRGLDQVVVTLGALDGGVLTEGVTDRDGTVRLTLPAPVDTLRVNVRGITATGTPLQLAPSERDGIIVRLLGPEMIIALGVEDDGMVLPDPATMAEPGGAGQPTTAASLAGLPSPAASVAPLPTVAPSTGATATPKPIVEQPAPAEFVDANGQPIAQQPSSLSRSALFLLALLPGIGCIVVGVWRLVRSRRGGGR